MTSRLTPKDIQALMSNPSTDVRAEIAGKVAAEIGHKALNPREREIAEQIVRLMVKDAAERVRQALATSLAHAHELPHDVAMALAQDVDAVSVPFVEASPVLSEEDLISLVRAGSTGRQKAIARRPMVSNKVADVLVGTGSAEVVRTLVSNPGALIAENTLMTIVQNHGTDQAIADQMVHRPELPLSVAERLVTLVTEHLRNHLINHHKVPQDLVRRLVEQSRERATVDLLDDARDASNIADLVRQLRGSGRLTPSLLLRAVCTGDMRLCEEAFAQLTGLPSHKAWILLHDAGPLGFRALFERAKMPEVLYPAFRTAIDVFHEMESENALDDRSRFEGRMLERVLTQYNDLDTDDLDYLLDRLSHMPQAGGPASGMAVGA